MRSLSAALVRIRHALADVAASLSADGIGPATLAATVFAEGSRGVRRVRVREHTLLSDAVSSLGDDDLGPSPVELQLAAIGACLTQGVMWLAAERSLPVDEVRVRVSARVDPRGGRPGFERVPVEPQGIAVALTLRCEASANSVTALVRDAEQRSPVLRLLRASQDVPVMLSHDLSDARWTPIGAVPS